MSRDQLSVGKVPVLTDQRPTLDIVQTELTGLLGFISLIGLIG